MIEIPNFDSWVYKESVKEDYKKDKWKRIWSKRMGLLLLVSFLLMMGGVISIIFRFQFWGYLLSFGIVLFFLSLIFGFYFSTFSLGKKYFLVYSLFLLSKILNEDYQREKEKKEISTLIYQIQNLFDKDELYIVRDSFEYSKFSSLKNELKDFTIFLQNKLINQDLNKLSGILYDLSVKIYEEKLESGFLKKILEAYKGDIKENPSKLRIFFIEKKNYLLAFFILFCIFLIGYFMDIPKEYYFGVIGTVFGGIIAWLIQRQTSIQISK